MRYILLITIITVLLACKQERKETFISIDKNTEEVVAASKNYPEKLIRVFQAHGGLKNWKKMKSLVFEISKPNGNEVHTVNLQSRKDRIDSPEFVIGHDGLTTWLLDKTKTYKGDPVFYHNLMFYFYAMPFVISDDGIVYSETKDLIFEGKKYPGIKISYNLGIGASYKDEYFVHFDAKTGQMVWLGYTVTYRIGEKSDKIKWIQYKDWAKVNGLVLPNSITWYSVEEGVIKEPRNTVYFENVVLDEESKPDSLFHKPEAAIVVEGK